MPGYSPSEAGSCQDFGPHSVGQNRDSCNPWQPTSGGCQRPIPRAARWVPAGQLRLKNCTSYPALAALENGWMDRRQIRGSSGHSAKEQCTPTHPPTNPLWMNGWRAWRYPGEQPCFLHCCTKGHLRAFGAIQWESECFNGRPKALCYPFDLLKHRFLGKKPPGKLYTKSHTILYTTLVH